ncbi:MAG: extracellular solute-binding protein [Gemmataceae bacterium]|nr:extracellular solute-binding protein [Gemmataceae bacterium]
MFGNPRRPLLAAALGSLAALGVLAILLYRDAGPGLHPNRPPLLVYCAAALKPAMHATAAGYEKETGTPVEFTFGNSEQVLAAAVTGRGDLLLPADDSYVRLAEAKGVVAEAVPLARMRAVVLARPGNPRSITRFDDLLAPDLKLGQANPDAAAIGKVTRDHLRTLGRWDALHANTTVYHTTVAEAANAVKVGSNDAAVVWDAVAAQYPDLAVVRLPELDGATARVELAVLKSAADPDAARRFVRYVRAADRGQTQFRAAGFADLEPGPVWDSGR